MVYRVRCPPGGSRGPPRGTPPGPLFWHFQGPGLGLCIWPSYVVMYVMYVSVCFYMFMHRITCLYILVHTTYMDMHVMYVVLYSIQCIHSNIIHKQVYVTSYACICIYNQLYTMYRHSIECVYNTQ